MTEANGFSVIGKPLPKLDAVSKVTGRADLRRRHAPRPHAPLPDPAQPAPARAHPLDRHVGRAPHARRAGRDHRRRPARSSSASCPVTQDERALEHEKVRYVGDPIAAVAATDEEIAAAACDAIAVEYEVLEPVMSIEDALARTEGRAHPGLRRPQQHPQARRPRVRRRRRRLRARRPHPRGRLLLPGQHAPADGAAQRDRHLSSTAR